MTLVYFNTQNATDPDDIEVSVEERYEQSLTSRILT